MKRFTALLCAVLVLSTVLGVSPTVAANETPETYIVQPGDTLMRVAARYGITVGELATANGLYWNSWIYVGQRLTIPGQAPGPAPAPGGNRYIVQAGDTLMSIAIRRGVTVSALAAANGLRWSSWVYVGQQLIIPGGNSTPAPNPAPAPASSAGGTHVVQAGENLFRISLRYGTTVAAIKVANGLASDIVYVGQRLIIPGGSGAPANPVPSQPAPAPSYGSSGEKWIDVNLTTQTVTAFEGQTPIYTALASTGVWGTPTVVGTYSIYVKYASTYMSGPGYSLPNVPYTMYFYRGYALHGTYWHNNFGTPMSHGCVNLSTPDAQWFFNWAPVGTKVVTHY